MRDRNNKSHPDIPVRVGEIVKLTAERLNDDGEGVASVHGFTVFVPHLLPSETGEAKITFVKKRFARAVLLERADSGEMRRDPDCTVFAACGGCQLQHVHYSEQLLHKERRIAWALRSLPQDELPVIRPILGMETPLRYRNQVQIPIRWSSNHRVEIGFYSSGSHDLVVTDNCHLESLAMETTARRLADWLTSIGPKVAGEVHHLIVRESFTTKDQMAIFAVKKIQNEFVEQLQSLINPYSVNHALAPLVSVGYTVQPFLDGVVWGHETKIVAGPPQLTETLHGVEYLISPRSFFQVNTSQATRLYDAVVDMAALTPRDRILDAYCGTGSISLLLASKGASSVVGIESIQAAIDDAKANSSHNHIGNATFLVGEVEIVLPQLVREGKKFDVAVLDPPRKGVHPDALQAVLDTKPSRIVYVSCNPATLGRDIGAIVSAGYRATQVQPVDMFPQTSHVECCVSLVRKS